ncbi:helix-turn-helix domain-containing protein [Chryseobacterium wanjuense]
MQVGQKIKRIRELKGLSQTEVAEKLFISQRAYSDIENDKTKLDLDRLENLSNIFEMDPLELLTFDEKKVFNNVFNDTSKGLFADKIIDDNFENERQSYQQQIKHLEEEILFLRNLIHKN